MRKILNTLYFKYLCRKYPNLKAGKNVSVDYGSQVIVYNNELILKDNVRIRSRQRGYHAGMPFPTTFLIDVKGAKITIGENCRLNGVYLHAQEEIYIGKNTVIASGVNIIDSNGHVLNSSDRTKGRDVPKAIHIGENVWIGLNAIILKGAVIGDNSVIAAGAVVKGEFSANSLISGNPAIVTDIIKIKDYEISNT